MSNSLSATFFVNMPQLNYNSVNIPITLVDSDFIVELLGRSGSGSNECGTDVVDGQAGPPLSVCVCLCVAINLLFVWRHATPWCNATHTRSMFDAKPSNICICCAMHTVPFTRTIHSVWFALARQFLHVQRAQHIPHSVVLAHGKWRLKTQFPQMAKNIRNVRVNVFSLRAYIAGAATPRNR